MLQRPVPAAPAYLQEADWSRASRGVLAIAINNHEDRFSKHYDLGRPDDAVVLSTFAGVDRWVLGIPATAALTLQAQASTRSPAASETLVTALTGLITLGRAAVDSMPAVDGPGLSSTRLAQQVLAQMQARQEGGVVNLTAARFGTFLDIIALLKTELAEATVDRHQRNEKSTGTQP